MAYKDLSTDLQTGDAKLIIIPSFIAVGTRAMQLDCASMVLTEVSQMKINRDGEQGGLPMRQQRFFQLHHYWYFATREGATIGPFDSYPQAFAGSRDYAEQIRDLPETAAVIRRYA